MFDTSAAGHDFNIDNGTFVVDASTNRVGIGTTTPSTLLDVNGVLTATTIAGTLTTAAQTNITSLGTLTGLTVDNITIDGYEIDSSTELVLDAAGDITFDADGGDWRFKDAGTTIATYSNVGGSWYITSNSQDGDIVFQGNDGGSTIAALTLDMSEGGNATFNGSVSTDTIQNASGNLNILSTGNILLKFDSDNNQTNRELNIQNNASDQILKITETGTVTFSGNMLIPDGSVSSPAIGFANDTDTGILRVTTNALGITAAGSRKFYVNATNAYFQNLTQVQIDSGDFYVDGDVGIGNPSPAQSLHVGSSSAGTSSNGIRIEQNEGAFDLRVDAGEFYLYDVTDTRIPFLIDTSGNVGIGLTSGISSKLHVNNQIVLGPDASNYGIINYGSNANQLTFGTKQSGTNYFDTIRITSGKVGIGTPPTHKLHVLSTDNASFLLDRNQSNEPASLNEFSSYYALSIKNRASGSYLNFGGGGAGAKIQATDGAGSATAKYIILQPYGGLTTIGGNVAPTAALTLIGDSGTQGSARIVPDSGKGNEVSHIHYGGTGDWYIRSASTSGKVIINDAGGNVGIGTSNVDSKLHVKSGANSTDGALRIESATGNIMDMGTDGTGHFINCVNTDPFRIKFAGSDKVTIANNGNLTASSIDAAGSGNRMSAYVQDMFHIGVENHGAKGVSRYGASTTRTYVDGGASGYQGYVYGNENWFPEVFIPYSPNQVYRLSVSIYQLTGSTATSGASSRHYLGLAGYDQNFNFVNVDSITTYQYNLASNVTVSTGNFYESDITLKGWQGSGQANYNKMDQGTVYIRPLWLCNYQSPGGTAVLTGFSIIPAGTVADNDSNAGTNY